MGSAIETNDKTNDKTNEFPTKQQKIDWIQYMGRIITDTNYDVFNIFEQDTSKYIGRWLLDKK